MPTSTFPSVLSFGAHPKGDIVSDRDNTDTASDMLIQVTDVQKIDADLYMSRSLWIPTGNRGVFGGAIVAQALRAAWNTVEDRFHIHSQHCYFLLAGRIDVPVLYQVERLRTGRSFATRYVTASQEGKPIFMTMCSFTVKDAAINLEHHAPMPSDLPEPESILTVDERIQNSMANLSEEGQSVKGFLERNLENVKPIDYREVPVDDGLYTEFFKESIAATPKQMQWIKAVERIESDDPKVHAAILAYTSDWRLLATSCYANGLTVPSSKIGMMASLDHTIWYHEPCRVDDWLLYDMHSPRSGDGRGLAFGRVYTRDGRLVMTTAQEGIVRLNSVQKVQEKQKATDLALKTQPAHGSRL
ncbi:HotDog domain-containing protein [Gongronella butleri]|nr:HotDog domain-containing protein [Gongronella butleri]